jgi:hypothetical protein
MKGSETSRLPHIPDYRLTDGGEVVSPNAGRRLPLGRFQVLISVRNDPRIRSIEKSNDIGNRTHDLPAGSIVPQPTTLLCAPLNEQVNQ